MINQHSVVKKVFQVVLGVAFLVALVILIPNKKNIQSIKIAGQNVKVELASTTPEQLQGLSGRTRLKENEGMLFVFDKPGVYSFWMKDMKFPLDMIWIDSDMKVIYIKKDAQPGSYPLTYTSNENAKYFLEVLAGFSAKNNLKIGDKVELLY